MNGSVQLLFWGGFFGVASVLAIAAVLTFVFTRIRASIEFAFSAVLSVAYVVVQLGWLRGGEQVTSDDRLQALVALASAALLGLLLSRLLRVERRERALQYAAYSIVGLGCVALAVSLVLTPQDALWLAAGSVGLCGLLGVGVCLQALWYGDRLALIIGVAALFMTVAGVGLACLAAVHGTAPASFHAISAASASSYLTMLAWASWMRYRYKLELRMAMRNSQTYDPLTRMSNAKGTAMALHAALQNSLRNGQPIGVISVMIANLPALQGLHGPEFVNHALFVLASRVKTACGSRDRLGRLGDEGFLIVIGHLGSLERFHKRGARLAEELRRPVGLHTWGQGMGKVRGIEWQAEVGLGMQVVAPGEVDTAKVLSMSRSLATSALSFEDRVASFDESAWSIVESPREARR